MKKSMLIASAFACLTISGQVAAEMPSGEAIAFTCWGCHGYQGKSTGTIPPLAGKKADYINTAMLEFKSDKRKSSIMNRIAKGYSEAEIKALADYIGSLGGK